MTTPKLRESDIARIQAEVERAVKEKICTQCNLSYHPDLSLSQIIEVTGKKNDPNFQTRLKKSVKGLMTNQFLIGNFEGLASALEPFFEGSQQGSSPQAQQAFKNFQYYNKMTVEAFHYFIEHLVNNETFFSADIYRQWLACANLGLYTAPDFVVLGKYGLNYSDNRDPSPRLTKLKSYLEHVYRCRVLIEVFDSQLTTSGGGDSYSLSPQAWNQYLTDIKRQLNKSFSSERASELFRQIFGSDNPDQPANAQLFQAYQQQALDRIALALLPEQQRNQPQSSGMNRNYVAEEQANQARQQEERQRREREKEEQQNSPPSPTQSEPAERGRIRSPSLPRQSGFNNSNLNDIINSMNEAMAEDSQAQEHNEGQSGFGSSPAFNGSLNSIMKEDAQKMPWLVMGYNLDNSGRWDGGLITGVDSYPFWKVYDPTTLATLFHGQGDIITLLCVLCQLESSRDHSNHLHNFFWAKNQDQKGFNRLVKDTEPAKEGAGETKLLITGKRTDDKRRDKMGWTSWNFSKGGEIFIGVPGVKQESYRITRNFRGQGVAYDLDDTEHFIGKLKEKGLLGGFSRAKRRGSWGSAPKKSLIWITNQMSYPYSKNMDWLGDDPNTINPNNSYSHYLIFSDYTTQEINEKFIANNSCQNLAELVGKLNGTLVRLGPDALELMDSQTREQKERSENETKESREKNKSEVTEQNLQEIGLTKEEWAALTTAFTDPAKIDNIIKKIAATTNPAKLAELLDKMFDHLHEKTAEAMFQQMVNRNPVFNDEQKQKLKEGYKNAKTKEDKKNSDNKSLRDKKPEKDLVERLTQKKEKFLKNKSILIRVMVRLRLIPKKEGIDWTNHKHTNSELRKMTALPLVKTLINEETTSKITPTTKLEQATAPWELNPITTLTDNSPLQTVWRLLIS